MRNPCHYALSLLPLLLGTPLADRAVDATDDQKPANFNTPMYFQVQANRVTSPQAIAPEMSYTHNTLCRQNNCVNPIFPALNDLPRLEAVTWQCSTFVDIQHHLDFCKDAVYYDAALPSPEKKATNVSAIVQAQEDAAMEMFVYHLGGLGYDAWDYQSPAEFDNECVRSIWKMVCLSYFPRSQAGCQAEQETPYLRPCRSSCQNYIKSCGVECCDESVKCVFTHTSQPDASNGQLEILGTGYVDAEGPSAYCTGAASRSMSSPLVVLLALFGFHYVSSTEGDSPRATNAAKTRRSTGAFGKLFCICVIGLLSVSLQGCNMQVPTHKIGYWRTKNNYLTQFKYTPPPGADQKPQDPMLNSCNVIPGTDQNLRHPLVQCSGRGYCAQYSKNPKAAMLAKPIAFCKCERDWADPECATRRKSQVKAFFFSVFLGFFGADHFYLGFPVWGVTKLITFGGFGFWWILDIVRIGAGPVYASNFRTANDLPHWVAVLVMLFIALFGGFLVAIENYLVYRKKKRQDAMFWNSKEEAQMMPRITHQMSKDEADQEMERIEGPRFRNQKAVPNFTGRPSFTSYGAALPIPLANSQAPYANHNGPAGNVSGGSKGVPSNGMFGPAGIPGRGSPTPPGMGVAPTHMGLGREGMMQRIDSPVDGNADSHRPPAPEANMA